MQCTVDPFVRLAPFGGSSRPSNHQSEYNFSGVRTKFTGRNFGIDIIELRSWIWN